MFCIPPSVGGAERVSLTVVKMLDQSEFDVHVAIVGSELGDIINFIPPNIKVHFVKIRNIWDFTTIKLIRLFRILRPHIVFSSLFYLNIRVIYAAKIVGGIKTIVRNNISFFRAKPLNDFLIRHSYPMADIVICQSIEMREEMLTIQHLDETKVTIIKNPIDTKTIDNKLNGYNSPYNNDEINYVYVGRIDETKGTDILISAFKQLVHNLPNAHLTIVGKLTRGNVYQEKMIDETKDLGDRVTWTGFCDNPYPYIKYASCFVLPSRVEGLPNVVLEAMYLQTPVVATRSVPIISRLIPKSRGITVQSANVLELVNAMQNILSLSITQPYNQMNLENEWKAIFY